MKKLLLSVAGVLLCTGAVAQVSGPVTNTANTVAVFKDRKTLGTAVIGPHLTWNGWTLDALGDQLLVNGVAVANPDLTDTATIEWLAVGPLVYASVPNVFQATNTLTEWTAGNVTWVPAAGDIQTYVNAAVAGDTLVLASDTILTAGEITITKRLNIIGWGSAGFVNSIAALQHGTRLNCTTPNATMFRIYNSNVRLANMTLTMSGMNSTGILIGTNFSGISLQNIDTIVTCSGVARGIVVSGSQGTLRDMTFYVDSSDDQAQGVYFYNNAATTQDNILEAYNVTGYVQGGATSAHGFHCYNNNDANTVTLNLYNCYVKVAAGTGLDVAVASTSTTTANSTVNALEATTLDGATWDSYQDGANVMALGGSILVNNLIFGTPTYRAAMATAAVQSPALNGGILANEDVTIQGTTHATKTTSYVILQPTAGNVGINKTAPTNALDVTGNISASGTIYAPWGVFGTNSYDVGQFGLLTVTNGISSSNLLTGHVIASNTVTASSVRVDDDPYSVAWNASTNVPTKNALFDRIDQLSRRLTVMEASGSTTLTGYGDTATVVGTPSAVAPATANPVGLGLVTTAATTGTDIGWAGNATIRSDGPFEAYFYFNLVETNAVRYWVGVSGASGATMAADSAPATDLIALRYSDGDADVNWMFCHNDGGVMPAAASTGVPVTSGLVKARITWDATTARAYINGVLVGSATTDVPRVNQALRGMVYGETTENVVKNIRIYRVGAIETDP